MVCISTHRQVDCLINIHMYARPLILHTTQNSGDEMRQSNYLSFNLKIQIEIYDCSNHAHFIFIQIQNDYPIRFNF